HDRLDDLRQLAADRARGVPGRRRPLVELLDARLDSRLAQHLRNTCNRVRPAQRAQPIRYAASIPSRSSFCSSGGAGVSIESAISALPPARLRETVMLAMFTPAAPKSVPTRPITPGMSSYSRKAMRGASSISSSNPSAETRKCRASLPIVVPATRTPAAEIATRLV